jgi:N-acetylmuramoyl-L-alanine amidase
MTQDNNPTPDDFYTDDADHNNDDAPNSGVPASSIFLEMMRQQANPPETYIWEPPKTPTDILANEREPISQPIIETPMNRTPLQNIPDDLPDPIEEAHLEAREQLRVERMQRRRAKKRMRAAGITGGLFRSLFTVSVTAVMMATIFTWWQGPEFLSADVRNDLSIALATATNQGIMVEATALPVTPNWLKRVGIISGHRGPENDPGAVCDDGLTEAEINLEVAQRVVRSLQTRGYTVDLLDEFDPRLNNYQGDALVSIHANTCRDYGELVTGFLISTADARSGSGNDQLLVRCHSDLTDTESCKNRIR